MSLSAYNLTLTIIQSILLCLNTSFFILHLFISDIITVFQMSEQAPKFGPSLKTLLLLNVRSQQEGCEFNAQASGYSGGCLNVVSVSPGHPTSCKSSIQ